MQRRPRTYAISAALAVTLTGGLAGCTGSSSGDTGEDTKPATGSSASPAAPGKYDSLPEPCSAVNADTLKKLLPGADSSDSGTGSGEQGASPYEGKAKVTYDTDRRVGCNWKGTTTLGTRHLAVDMERVVSYDPSVSDDEQAELLYDERAGQAEIPSSDAPSADESSPGAESASPSPGDGQNAQGQGAQSQSAQKQNTQGQGAQKQSAQGQNAQGDRHAQPAAPSSSASPSDGASPSDSPSGSPSDKGSPSASPGDDLSPRMLGDVGDSAYINDQLDTRHSGVHRDITLVFRSSNVIATVTYDQWTTDKRRLPDSAELQGKARTVAQQLAAHFDEE